MNFDDNFGYFIVIHIDLPQTIESEKRCGFCLIFFSTDAEETSTTFSFASCGFTDTGETVFVRVFGFYMLNKVAN